MGLVPPAAAAGAALPPSLRVCRLAALYVVHSGLHAGDLLHIEHRLPERALTSLVPYHLQTVLRSSFVHGREDFISANALSCCTFAFAFAGTAFPLTTFCQTLAESILSASGEL